MTESLFPAGHFYSPVPDVQDLATRREQLWPSSPQIEHIDFNDGYHRHVLTAILPKYLPEFDFPRQGPEDEALERFYIDNSQLSHLDCRMLFALLRAWRPNRLIEIGGGYSTLLSSEVNHRFLDSRMHFTCIEPYPRPFLERERPGLSELIVERVERVALDRFESLTAGDIVFIDSSHVCKTGSDVNYLYFEVIPRLRPGVRVHVHDIFLPEEYPEEWVIDQNRAWNEQYLLRAMLTHNPHYRVLFGSHYAFLNHAGLIRKALGLPEGQDMGGGSFWFEIAGADPADTKEHAE